MYLRVRACVCTCNGCPPVYGCQHLVVIDVLADCPQCVCAGARRLPGLLLTWTCRPGRPGVHAPSALLCTHSAHTLALLCRCPTDAVPPSMLPWMYFSSLRPPARVWRLRPGRIPPRPHPSFIPLNEAPGPRRLREGKAHRPRQNNGLLCPWLFSFLRVTELIQMIWQQRTSRRRRG